MSATPRKPSAKPGTQDFTALVDAVRRVHDECAAAVTRTVNTTLTLRNWLIGGYIRDYEQNGADRAKYGSRLLENLSDSLQGCLDRCYTGRYLGLCRQLFDTYPSIRKSVISESGIALVPGILEPSVGQPETRKSVISEFETDSWTLVQRLSFTHLVELLAIEDPLKRTFYEIECIRGNWSVRALKRQIATLYYERSGLSKNKDKLADLAHAAAEKAEPKLAIRDPYIFEFLGLKSSEVVSESNLEDALLENLHDFLMELGHGFCLEARQKSIVIGNTRGFVDLVFYHRILKCHVLIELKVDKFTHEHLGQLNTYVSWYRKHMMTDGDNPPVGLLLCTQKDHVLVEYATANMDNRLFVSKYQLELPKKEELEHFLETKRREITEG
ncbi:YhcG family protein [Desulfococcus sp.]|uniref:PDDEXK nuclease domain-containing protein n=1 Tax=Desulfococcus sp. TaxID=2025834 RepID=UPI0035947A6A